MKTKENSNKRSVLQVRMEEEEKEKLAQAAKLEHLGMSAWTRKTLLERAEQILKKHGVAAPPR
jgi:uncharacterized protein (DUF1778 family)